MFRTLAQHRQRGGRETAAFERQLARRVGADAWTTELPLCPEAMNGTQIHYEFFELFINKF